MNTDHDIKQTGDYKAYLYVFLTAIAFRVFFLIWVDEPGVFIKYPYFAEKLAAGEDIGERLIDLSPFYLYWMTGLSFIFGPDWAAVKWLQSFIGAIVCLLVFALGDRAFQKKIGCLAALIYAAYGNLIILESTLEPTVFVLLFNLSAVYLLQIAREGPTYDSRRNRLIFAGGLLSGLSVITKPSFLLFLPLGALWVLTLPNRKLSFQRRIMAAVLFCAGACMIILPVTIRNTVKFKDFILVTADAGKVFFHGNSRGATALEWTGLPDGGFSEEDAEQPDYAHVLYRRTASRLSGKTLSPSESSKFWMQKTLKDIADDPKVYIMRELKKLVFFFSDYELHYIASAYKEYKASQQFPFIRYGIIASLGLAGMVLSMGAFRARFLIYGTILLYLASGMLFIVQSRYRTPAVPYLCLFAAYTLYRLKEEIRTGRLKFAGIIVLLAGVLFFISHYSLKAEIYSSDQWHTATKIYYQLGARPHFAGNRYQNAVKDLNACLAIAPNFSPAYNLRGKADAMMEEYGSAETDFKKVVELSPASPKGYKNLGFLYLLLGRSEDAKKRFLKARYLSPHDEKILNAIQALENAERL